METEALLLWTALSVAVMHTILGPDHYLPFVAIAKARSWTWRKTAFVTSACGVGHAAGSIVLGVLGIWLGANLTALTGLESMRGDWAAWALVAFGLVYGAWGLRRALKGQTHAHAHAHADGTVHVHEHNHRHGHGHFHGARALTFTPFALFVIFVLGPCEPLIPLMMVPATDGGWTQAAIVACGYTIATVATMLAVVFASLYGMKTFAWPGIGRFGHAVAGSIVAFCGLTILTLGW